MPNRTTITVQVDVPEDATWEEMTDLIQAAVAALPITDAANTEVVVQTRKQQTP